MKKLKHHSLSHERDTNLSIRYNIHNTKNESVWLAEREERTDKKKKNQSVRSTSSRNNSEYE